MNLDVYTLISPAYVEPGQTIVTRDGNLMEVDEVVRTADAVTFRGYHPGGTRSRRFSESLPANHDDISMVPSARTLADVWQALTDAVVTAASAVTADHSPGEDPPRSPWTTQAGSIVVAVGGRDYWLEPAGTTPPGVIDVAPLTGEPV